MNLKEPMSLTDGKQTIEIPLENHLRIFFKNAQPLAEEYKKTGKRDLDGFFEWLKDKLEMRGGKVLG